MWGGILAVGCGSDVTLIAVVARRWKGQGTGCNSGKASLITWLTIFFLLQVNYFLCFFFFFNALKEIVDRYEGKIWEDFFTKHFEQVSACMSKLLQSYYVAL